MALEIGDSIPKDIQEKLELQEDKVYVINFFASWCKSCKKELPLVLEVYNNKIVDVIGINVDKKKEDGEMFVNALKLTFPIFYDTEKSLVEIFDPLGFPAIYYVKNGQILKVLFGAVEGIDKKIINDIKEMK
jgi:thiol-disulfide isomerase/thioredoxin